MLPLQPGQWCRLSAAVVTADDQRPQLWHGTKPVLGASAACDAPWPAPAVVRMSTTIIYFASAEGCNGFGASCMCHWLHWLHTVM